MVASPHHGPAKAGHGFGTLPVFMAGISTILGAIMFLRFGYAVGQVGLLGIFFIIGLGHLVTVPTALALAEIATNRRVEGGGEYYIISRSFGTTIGGVIGISLYLSQAISVAFYMIAFAEAFEPVAAVYKRLFDAPFDLRFISVPGLVALMIIVFYKGASMGIKVLYVVVGILVVSLAAFFLAGPVEGYQPGAISWGTRVDDADAFFYVFAIVFPAFTGMTAGVGLSGDLRNPRVSVPRGTLAATIVGLIAYIFIVLKLHVSAPPEALAERPLIMTEIAWWGPFILIGLASATLSSAIGSALVAPRTLQALGGDRNIPLRMASGWLAKGSGTANEPRNATLATGVVALAIVLLGNVDIVARLISMFFMVTYGALCAISFMEHFAARPSYRPSFRSRWYISLLGAVMCLFLMFQMDPLFAFLAMLLMTLLYLGMRLARRREDDLAAMFQGVMTQAMRYMHIRLQRRRRQEAHDEWRPSIIMVSDRTFDRRSPLMMVRWLCHRHGFGTYLHRIPGFLDAESFTKSMQIKRILVDMAERQRSTVYMDTIVSPSMTSALAQTLQIPGVTGMPNNMVLFEFSQQDPPEVLEEVVKYCRFADSVDKTLLVLRHGDNQFRERDSIHIWLTWSDQGNANMMILLSYILLGHPDWRAAAIQVFAAVPKTQVSEIQQEFGRHEARGRLPISEKNIEVIPTESTTSFQALVASRSKGASLVVAGFGMDRLDEKGASVFTNYPIISDILFVYAPKEVSFE